MSPSWYNDTKTRRTACTTTTTHAAARDANQRIEETDLNQPTDSSNPATPFQSPTFLSSNPNFKLLIGVEAILNDALPVVLWATGAVGQVSFEEAVFPIIELRCPLGNPL